MTMMNRYLAYLKYVIRHKWFVFQECCKLGIPILGLLHDWSKLRPSEFVPYARYFYNPDGSLISRRDEVGYYKPTNTDDEEFDFAWLLHQKRNKHHWQWWILPEDEGEFKIFPIQDKYRREMLADWRGAGRAQGTPDTKSWYYKYKDVILLCPTTRGWIEERLGVVSQPLAGKGV